MTMIITDDCINCSACAFECPTEAVFYPGNRWSYEGKKFAPLSIEHFFIVTEICNECSGLINIKCISICPMAAIKRF